MKAPIIILAIILLIAQQSESFAQVPRTITYQGIIQKDGGAFTGDGLFTFTLYKVATAIWISQPMTIHVTGGLFSTVLGPFPDSIQFNGVDSLGVTFGGIELSPRIGFTSVAYSLYALRAAYADSSKTLGPKGDPGQQGLQGLKGEKGDSGAIGPQGSKGFQGLKGDSGAIGPEGLKGVKGDIGTSGLNGDKGDKGDPGLQGVKGDIGTAGVNGAKGDNGSQGIQGLKGDVGVKGDNGVQGSQGVTGVIGPQGSKGDNGTPGVNGAKGDNGSQGIQGLIGEAGVKGDNGAAGVNGAKGDNGSQGIQGLIGEAGVKGDNGTPGVNGASGAQGSQGVKGDKGVNPLSSIPNEGIIVFTLNQVTLVWTGAAVLRLQNANPAQPATYSVFWYSGDGVAVVEAHNGTVVGTPVDFTIGVAYQFSITVKVATQWEKIDLVRDLTDNNWYGSSTSSN